LIRGRATVSFRGGPSRARPGSLFPPAVLLLALTWASAATASPLCVRGALADSIAEAVRGVADQSQIGIMAVAIDAGDIVVALNEERRMIPGSNAKLFTTSAFLRKFGPDARFETRIEARGKVERKREAVRLKGDLVLRPSGTPDVVPILAAGSRGLLDSLAFLLRAGGLTRFEGTLWVDGTLFAQEPYGPGWAADDIPWSYGAVPAPVFANGNAATLVATGAERVSFQLEPPETPLEVASDAAVADTGSTGWMELERELGSTRLLVHGAVPRGVTLRKQISVPAPDSSAGLWLLGAMRRAGIRVDATVRLVPHAGGPGNDRTPGEATPADSGWERVGKDRTATVLTYRSPPAAALVGIVNALSLNAEAEGLNRLLDPLPREKRRAAGLAESRRMAAEVGIDTLDLSLVDGSGLSPQNLVTARALVGWLVANARDSALAAPFREGLAVPGGPGTLKRRFAALAPEADLHGKTGTLTNVSSISGYVTDAAGERIAFAVITNGNRASTMLAKQLEERVVAIMTRYHGGRGAASPPPRIPR